MTGWRLKPTKCWKCGKRCMWGMCPACRKESENRLKEEHTK